MRQYISFFKMSLMKGLQYRVAALAGIATQFFFGFVFIMIFQAFYTFATAKPDISLEQLVQMVWLQQSFLMFIMLWFRDPELYDMITSGNIAYELCRPTSLYKYWFSRLLGQRLSGAILRFLPILLIASIMPAPYTLKLPDNLLTLLLFIITLLLGLLLVIAMSMLIYISVFYTLSPTGSFLLFAVFGEFLGGATIPIPLMPKWLQSLCYVLPFRYSSDLPFRLYAGHITHQEAYFSIAIQLFWICILGMIGHLWMKQALKRVIVQGG